MKRFWGGVACLLVVLTQVAIGQPDSTAKQSNWSASVGASFLHVFSGKEFDIKATTTIPGWNAKFSEYPFRSHPWIGGTAELSGYYVDASHNVSNSTENVSEFMDSQVYTFLAGPSVALTRGRVEPFANVLVGLVHTGGGAEVIDSGAVLTISTGYTSVSALGVSAGGGVDLPLYSRWKIHTQANWLRDFSSGTSADFIQGSAGITFRF